MASSGATSGSKSEGGGVFSFFSTFERLKNEGGPRHTPSRLQGDLLALWPFSRGAGGGFVGRPAREPPHVPWPCVSWPVACASVCSTHPVSRSPQAKPTAQAPSRHRQGRSARQLASTKRLIISWSQVRVLQGPPSWNSIGRWREPGAAGVHEAVRLEPTWTPELDDPSGPGAIPALTLGVFIAAFSVVTGVSGTSSQGRLWWRTEVDLHAGGEAAGEASAPSRRSARLGHGGRDVELLSEAPPSFFAGHPLRT